ncbi:cyanophycin synthetase [Saccharomonospora sp. NPDC046836]|uniref:bifunctional folylpolyglutamate synthase/dihydrofolate synthase n=1 Tax=Saccharomonospora sp. NPDC046836 TaxID=3156921 RepID=UPI0033FE8AC1
MTRFEPIATLDEVERYLLAELPSSSATVVSGGVGRRRAAILLSLLGNPQNGIRTVHIAGTAGKGSVSTFVTAVLRAHGFRVGTYLSPHVHSLLERFQLDGAHAPVRDVAAALNAVRHKEIELSRGPLGAVTMFEAATAAAFQLFRDRGVDYAVIETGLGGWHDATNTVTRQDKLAVLTAIGLDHTELLGATLPEIARQKAGILPQDGSAIALRCGPAIDEIVAAEALHRGCRLDAPHPDDLAATLPDLGLGLPGRHQRINAGLAIRAAQHLADRDGWRLDPDRAAGGLREARLPGRFERRRWRGHPLVLDGAHNPMKLAALAEAVQQEWPRRAPVWVLTIKSGKDLPAIMDMVAPAAAMVVATEFGTVGTNHKPLPAEEIAAAARRAGVRVATEPRLAEALGWAVELSEPDVPVIVTGSFHAVADAGMIAAPVNA